MAKYIYILFFILLKVAYISAANKIVISDSSKLKGVKVETYNVKVRTANESLPFQNDSLYEDTNETFDVLNIANPDLRTLNGVRVRISSNNLDSLDIDKEGLYINNEVLNQVNIVHNNNIYGTLNNSADIIILNVNLPSTTNINGAVNVLGRNAYLAIQNSNGVINCNACSFGNVNNLQLASKTLNITNATLHSRFGSLELIADKLSVNFSDITFEDVFLESFSDTANADTISIIDGSITANNLFIASKAGLILDNVLLNVSKNIEATAETFNTVYLKEVNSKYMPNLTLESKTGNINLSKRDTNTRFKQFNEVSLIAPEGVYLSNIELLSQKINIQAGDINIANSSLKAQEATFEASRLLNITHGTVIPMNRVLIKAADIEMINSTLESKEVALEASKSINILNSFVLPFNSMLITAGTTFTSKYTQYGQKNDLSAVDTYLIKANDVYIQDSLFYLPEIDLNITATNLANIYNPYINAKNVNINAKSLMLKDGRIEAERLHTKTFLNTVVDDTVLDLSNTIFLEAEMSFIFLYLNRSNIVSATKPNLFIKSHQSSIFIDVKDPSSPYNQAYNYFRHVIMEASDKIYTFNNVVFNKNYITDDNIPTIQLENQWFYRYRN